jgi:hypothetical protein
MSDEKDGHADVHDIEMTPFNIVRYLISIGLLIFSLILVGALIFTENTRVANEANPVVALIVCIAAVFWLTMIEGQQASLVGLPPVDPDLYKDSHPGTYKNAAIAFKGDNLDRYLMGRQFMVLMVVFTINQAAGPLNPGGDVLGMPDGVKFVFLDIGLGMVIFTCILGQLSTQVIASHCMIDYINNYFALFTLYVCMFVEFTGIMHSSYLIQNILAAVSGKPIITNEPPRTGFTFAFFWGRVLMSLAILGFAWPSSSWPFSMARPWWPSSTPASPTASMSSSSSSSCLSSACSRPCRSPSSPWPNSPPTSAALPSSGRRPATSSSRATGRTSLAS